MTVFTEKEVPSISLSYIYITILCRSLELGRAVHASLTLREDVDNELEVEEAFFKWRVRS